MARKTPSAPALDIDEQLETNVSPETAETKAESGKRRAELDLPLSAFRPPLSRQGDESRPICTTHNCLMKAASTQGGVTYYACPVPKCGEKEKRLRKELHVPAEPQRCPDVRCEGKESFLQVDPARSSLAFLCMACPACDFHLKQPRPQFAPVLKRRREQAVVEDLSAR